MIRSCASLLTLLIYINSCFVEAIQISLTNDALVQQQQEQEQQSQSQRIVNQTIVATGITGRVHQFLVSNYGRPRDILAGGTNGVYLYPNFGSFGTPERIVGGIIEGMCDGDFNGDGMADFVYAMDDSSAALRVALQTNYSEVTGQNGFDITTLLSGTGLVSPTTGATILSSRTIGRNVKVADMDGDGKYDIIVTVNGADGDALKGALIYLRNTGDGINYETQILADDLGGIALLKLGDLDGDGRVDIVVVGVDSRQMTIYYNEQPSNITGAIVGAGGNFTKLVLDTSAESNLCIAIGDFNSYANADILAIGPTTIHFYLNNFGRNYQKWDMFDYIHEPNTSEDYHDFSCALYDMDGNGLIDIVYTQGLQGMYVGVDCQLPLGF
jgi:FG-GAP-like repeat